MATTSVFSENEGIFATNVGYGQQTLLPAQTSVADPNVDALESSTGPVVPDYAFQRRITHFPDEIYDLRPTSHLVRFLKVLLGDTGAGQLRKRYLLTRLQQDMESSHFFDLDGFWGSIFGALRHADEQLPMDPMESTATAAEWDEIHAKDTSFRERLFHLARAVPLGATVPGLKTAAEAIFQAPVDIFEVWSLMDEAGVGPMGTRRTWDQVESTYPTWSALEGLTWTTVAGIISIGQSITDNRAEVIIRPKKQWATSRQEAAEEWDARRVLNRLKPAGTLLTIDPRGVALHTTAQISQLTADSEFWEVIPTVQPKTTVPGWREVYPTPTGYVDGPYELPRPPFSSSQGDRVSYNTNIVSVQTYAETPDGVPTTQQDYESITYPDGARAVYSGDRAVLTQREVLSAHYVSSGVMVAHPYSQSRVPAVSHE